MNLQIFIFSFNRSILLANLIGSIVKGIKVPYTITILDDSSDNIETKIILDLFEISKMAKVLYIKKINTDNFGGLRYLMKYAMDNLLEDDAYSIFLQDDMQIVREIYQDDLANLINLTKITNNPFVYVNFFQTMHNSFIKQNKFFHYCYHKKNNLVRSISDTFFLNNKKYIESQYIWSISKQENSYQIREKFGGIPFYNIPFVMFLPQPKVFKKQNEWITNYFNKKNGRVSQYKFIDKEQLIKLHKSLKAPFADDYLATISSSKIIRPLIFRSTIPVNCYQKILLILIKIIDHISFKNFLRRKNNANK